jgi:hypothetical protein
MLMKYFCLLNFLWLVWLPAFTQVYTGVYQYHRGINKAQGTIYLTQFKPDSVFVIVNVISGAPDFTTVVCKGFGSLDGNKASTSIKDNCIVNMMFRKNLLTVSHDSSCALEYPIRGSYKKLNTELKKQVTFMTDFSEKLIRSTKDSIVFYNIPHKDGSRSTYLCNATDLKIIDEYGSYYLVEHRKFPKDFLWIPKKELHLPKK